MDFMERALALAERALGWCSPNPAVGAVVARDGKVVGEGHTQAPGQAHAEIMALRAAGPAANGATLFVTLEPCSHYGRTPPCTDAIIAAGIREVQACMPDPSPWVDGGGIRALQAAGIAVQVGAHCEEARRLNEAYFKWVATRLPFVTLKYAMTADGKIATRTGASFWITGLEARRHVAHLRARTDAVMVGIGTILADDPQLTARPGELGEPELEPAHQPCRVVFDSRARLPLSARVVSGGLPGKTLLFTTDQADPRRLGALERAGVEVIVLPEIDGRVDICAGLRQLGERQVISALAECGGTLAASLVEAGAVDRVVAFVAPRLVGGITAPSPVSGRGVDTMQQALDLMEPQWTAMGHDMMLSAYLNREAACYGRADR